MPRPKLEIDISRVEELAAQGLTREEIALCLGVSETTLYNRRRESEVFDAAIKSGKAKAASEIANKLYQLARGGDLGAIIWYEKTRRGLSDRMQQQITVDVSKLSDDELRAIAEG
jgi:transcriptional regulator with XRE-family HTH domain